MPPESKDVTTLLLEWSGGKRQAFDELMPLVYQQLRHLAAHQLRRERPNHTLESTALVHEAYQRLVDLRDVDWQNRAHSFAVSAQLMRRILVDYARSRLYQARRGVASCSARTGSGVWRRTCRARYVGALGCMGIE